MQERLARRVWMSAVGASALALSTTLFLVAPITSAVTPPSASPGPTASPSPTASPFPYPTVSPASDVPHGRRLVPEGRPDATVTRHGVRLELWRSSPAVAPGEWVRFAVRTTNVGRGSAWQMAGECNTSGTGMTADLRAVTPAGETQTGNAAAYKERVTKHWMPEWVPAWVYLDQLWATATAWAECGIVPGPLELRPGQSRVEHFGWYAGNRLGREGGLWRPPFPGTATFSVEWPVLSRGDRPRISDARRARTDPIRLQVPLTITGDGPGTPSLDELVDLALADPAWRAWVEADPSRNGWDRDYVRAHLLAGPDYPGPFLNTFDHPNGILELTLHQWLPGQADTVQGWILLDPWTGEVIHVRVPEWALTPSPSPEPS